MEKFKTLTSQVAPLPMSDVDTDMIYPAQFLTSISRQGCGKNLFRSLRDKDPNFVLDQPKYKNAQILVVDSNFGCGSSREHARLVYLRLGHTRCHWKIFRRHFLQ